MSRIETDLKCTKKQVQAVVKAKNAYKEALLSILHSNFPKGTRFRQRWLERGKVGDPVFEITGHFLYNDQLPVMVLIADLEEIVCLEFKKLDSLGRPNGLVKGISPEQFRFWFEVI